MGESFLSLHSSFSKLFDYSKSFFCHLFYMNFRIILFIPKNNAVILTNIFLGLFFNRYTSQRRIEVFTMLGFPKYKYSGTFLDLFHQLSVAFFFCEGQLCTFFIRFIRIFLVIVNSIIFLMFCICTQCQYIVMKSICMFI